MYIFTLSLAYNKEQNKFLAKPNHTTKHYKMKQDKIKIKGLKIKSILKLTTKNTKTNQSPKGGGYTWVG